MTTDSVDLVHAPMDTGLARMPYSADEARLAMEQYQAISNALIDRERDIQIIKTRKGTSEFPKRSALQKLANAYRVSTEIVSEHIDYDDKGEIIRARYRIRATHPDGRYTEGTGSCSRNEDRFARGDDKIDHDLPATAETRAKNRAIADLIAFGAVSAEEAEAGEQSAGPVGGAVRGLPDWAAPMNDIPGVAHNLTRILKAAGIESTAPIVEQIGDTIFKQADGSFPFIAARVAYLLAEAIEGHREGYAEGMATAEADEGTDVKTEYDAVAEATDESDNTEDEA